MFNPFKLVMAIGIFVFGIFPPILGDDSEIPNPGADQSAVVFLRPSSYGGKLWVGLYEVNGENQNEFIGLLRGKQKVVYYVKPGEHLFMAYHKESADFIRANLLPGKTYRVLLRPSWVIPYMQLSPIHRADLESPQQAEFLLQCQLVDKSFKEKWAADPKTISRVEKMRRKFHKKWISSKDASSLAHSILAEDGF